MMCAYLVYVYVYPGLSLGTQRKDEKRLTRKMQAHSRRWHKDEQRAHRSATEMLWVSDMVSDESFELSENLCVWYVFLFLFLLTWCKIWFRLWGLFFILRQMSVFQLFWKCSLFTGYKRFLGKCYNNKHILSILPCYVIRIFKFELYCMVAE